MDANKVVDYEGFWNVTMGANRSAHDVVAEFDLSPGVAEWVYASVATAIANGYDVDASDRWQWEGRIIDELESVFTD